MYLFISLFSCVIFLFPREQNNCSETPTIMMKEDKEELKEEGEVFHRRFNREVSRARRFGRRRCLYHRAEEDDAKNNEDFDAKRTDGTNAAKKKKNEKENVKAMIDRSFGGERMKRQRTRTTAEVIIVFPISRTPTGKIIRSTTKTGRKRRKRRRKSNESARCLSTPPPVLPKRRKRKTQTWIF